MGVILHVRVFNFRLQEVPWVLFKFDEMNLLNEIKLNLESIYSILSPPR